VSKKNTTVKQRIIERVAPPFAALLLKGINFTIRWHRVSEGELDPEWLERDPHLFAFWHNRQLMLPFCFKREGKGKSRKIFILISAHRDGRLIADTVQYLGIGSVAGSSSRGGARASRELLSRYNEGGHIGITPDGPRGPRYKPKPGIVRLAQKSGGNVFPVAVAAERKWEFRSWDKMFLPKPFSRMVLYIGSPLAFSESDELEGALQVLEEALCDVTVKADNFTYEASTRWRS